MKDRDLEQWLRTHNRELHDRIAAESDPEDRLVEIMATSRRQASPVNVAVPARPPSRLLLRRVKIAGGVAVAGAIGLSSFAVTPPEAPPPDSSRPDMQTAVAQLNSPDVEERRNAIADLETIAFSEPSARGTVMEALTTFVRTRAPAGPACTGAAITTSDVEAALWAIRSRNIRPNNATIRLSYTCLAGAVLSGWDLSGADLTGADLRAADLDDANLARTNLTGASLGGATLLDANLADANLAGADLRSAWLSGADLSGANFTNANLAEANLTDSIINSTDFTNANLNGAVGIL